MNILKFLAHNNTLPYYSPKIENQLEYCSICGSISPQSHLFKILTIIVIAALIGKSRLKDL